MKKITKKLLLVVLALFVASPTCFGMDPDVDYEIRLGTIKNIPLNTREKGEYTNGMDKQPEDIEEPYTASSQEKPVEPESGGQDWQETVMKRLKDSNETKNLAAENKREELEVEARQLDKKFENLKEDFLRGLCHVDEELNKYLSMIRAKPVEKYGLKLELIKVGHRRRFECDVKAAFTSDKSILEEKARVLADSKFIRCLKNLAVARYEEFLVVAIYNKISKNFMAEMFGIRTKADRSRDCLFLKHKQVCRVVKEAAGALEDIKNFKKFQKLNNGRNLENLF